MDTYPVGDSIERTTLLCLEVKPPHAERAVRATAQALQVQEISWSASIDILTCDPGERPEIFEHGLLIYSRDPNIPDTSELAPGLPNRRLGSVGNPSER